MESFGKENKENNLKWKELIREGIPDNNKRACILQFFGILPANA